jgi:hypothetical protein
MASLVKWLWTRAVVVPVGLAILAAELVERLPRTFVLPDGRRLRRGMTRAEVEALLAPGTPDRRNATRKVDVKRWTHADGVVVVYRAGRLRRVTRA